MKQFLIAMTNLSPHIYKAVLIFTPVDTNGQWPRGNNTRLSWFVIHIATSFFHTLTHSLQVGQ